MSSSNSLLFSEDSFKDVLKRFEGVGQHALNFGLEVANKTDLEAKNQAIKEKQQKNSQKTQVVDAAKPADIIASGPGVQTKSSKMILPKDIHGFKEGFNPNVGIALKELLEKADNVASMPVLLRILLLSPTNVSGSPWHSTFFANSEELTGPIPGGLTPKYAHIIIHGSGIFSGNPAKLEKAAEKEWGYPKWLLRNGAAKISNPEWTKLVSEHKVRGSIIQNWFSLEEFKKLIEMPQEPFAIQSDFEQMRSYPMGQDIVANLKTNDLFLARSGFVPLALEYLEKIVNETYSKDENQTAYHNDHTFGWVDFDANQPQGRLLCVCNTGFLGGRSLAEYADFIGW